MTTHLYLVRHGETDWNKQRRIQGSTDIPLNEAGRAQAADAARLLLRRKIDGVVASPLSRAFETGSIIADALGLSTPETFDDLSERAYGDAEGMTGPEIEVAFPDGAVPGRESRKALLQRVTEALGEIAIRYDGAVVVVATHGAVIRCIVNAAAPGVADSMTTPIRNGSIHSFRWDPERFRAELVRFDDPIDVESDGPGRYAFAYQNPLERSTEDDEA